MSDPATLPALPTLAPPDEAHWSHAFALRQLQLLGELAELGLDVARAVERQAGDMHSCVSPDPRPALAFQGDPALAYARVSRAVRLTLMLQAKLIDAMKAAETADAAARTQPDRFSPEYQRKARVERIVERLAEAEHPDAEDQVTDLLAEAAERLDDEDLYGDLLDRPMSELVARICQDLGLAPDWAGLAQELWAVKEVESGQPGWPLAGLAGQTRPPPPAGVDIHHEGDRPNHHDGAHSAFRRETG